MTSDARTADKRFENEVFRTESDHPVEVFGRMMNVNIQGSGDEVVVILPGRGVTAPSYDFAPLIARLRGARRVLTIDYFGSGLSDMTEEPRDSDHIVNEVHEALSKLKVKNYTIVAHSISGIYALHMSNLFPGEIKAFVGIDTAFPKMDQFITPELMKETSSPERPLDEPYDVREDINDVVGYVYSDRELTAMQALYERNRNNDSIFESRKSQTMSVVRANRPYDTMSFPNSMPTLFFLSSESVGLAPNWYAREHQKQCTPAAASCVKILEGGHFLHHSQAVAIARGIISI